MRYLASENIKIFPNPASDYLFVVNLPVGEKTVIRIYSILGKLIKSQHVRRYHELQIPVNISGLSEGTYVCTVSFSGKNHTAKFLKE
jgi:hypothetical protein